MIVQSTATASAINFIFAGIYYIGRRKKVSSQSLLTQISEVVFTSIINSTRPYTERALKQWFKEHHLDYIYGASSFLIMSFAAHYAKLSIKTNIVTTLLFTMLQIGAHKFSGYLYIGQLEIEFLEQEKEDFLDDNISIKPHPRFQLDLQRAREVEEVSQDEVQRLKGILKEAQGMLGLIPSLDEQMGEVPEFQGFTEQLTPRIERIKKAEERLNKKMAKGQSRLDKCQKLFASNFEKLRKSLEAKERSIEQSYQEKLAELSASRKRKDQTFNKELKTLQAELKSVQDQLSEKKQKLENLSLQHGVLSKEKARLEGKFTRKSEENNKIQFELNERTEELCHEQLRVAKLNKKTERFSDENERLKSEIKQKQAEWVEERQGLCKLIKDTRKAKRLAAIKNRELGDKIQVLQDQCSATC